MGHVYDAPAESQICCSTVLSYNVGARSDAVCCLVAASIFD